MRVLPFHEQSLENRCINVGEQIKIIASGQDSIVLRDFRGNKAVHVYHYGTSFDNVLTYARCVNSSSLALENDAYTEDIILDGIKYRAEVHVNPVEEIGEKDFNTGSRHQRNVYTVSPFIEGPALCWPIAAEDEQQLMLARCFDMTFYDRVNDWISERAGIKHADINPVNVKFKIKEDGRKVLLTITDIAKSIANIYTFNQI